jgi:hypothetical protein
MSAVYQFRLTGILFHQIRRSGKSIAAVLASWNDGDYDLLCDYVRDCKSVVPKYVRQIADLLDVSPKKVIKDILACRRGCAYTGNENEDEGNDCFESYSFGEDSVDLTLFIQRYCNEIKQYM